MITIILSETACNWLSEREDGTLLHAKHSVLYDVYNKYFIDQICSVKRLDISVLLVVICLVHINKNQANLLTSGSFNNPLHWPMTSEAFYPRYGVLSSLTVSSFVAIWVAHLMTKNQTLLIYNYYICFIVYRLYMSIGEFLISWCERYWGSTKCRWIRVVEFIFPFRCSTVLTRPNQSSCPRLQFLAFILDSIMSFLLSFLRSCQPCFIVMYTPRVFKCCYTLLTFCSPLNLPLISGILWSRDLCWK